MKQKKRQEEQKNQEEQGIWGEQEGRKEQASQRKLADLTIREKVTIEDVRELLQAPEPIALQTKCRQLIDASQTAIQMSTTCRKTSAPIPTDTHLSEDDEGNHYYRTTSTITGGFGK